MAAQSAPRAAARRPRARASRIRSLDYTNLAVQPIEAQSRLYERNGQTRRAYERLSDVELVRKATSGDAGALDALVTRHAPRVNRLAAQLLGDFEEARDAAQES